MMKTNKGYTLLFAVLVSSLVLAIGISILTISKKEFLLATSARDSSSAFYAADGGIDCAIYANNSGNFNISPINNILCATTPLPTVTNNVSPYTFEMRLGSVGTSCAIVGVDTTSVNGKTIITSKGYNMGWNTSTNRCDIPSAKKVEREIIFSY